MNSSKLKLNKNLNKNKKNEEKIEDSIKRSNYKKKQIKCQRMKDIHTNKVYIKRNITYFSQKEEQYKQF